MRWAWLWALWALGGVPGGAPCLLCSPEAAAALGELLGPFLARELPQAPAQRAELGTLLLRGTLGLARLPRDPQTFMGVIGSVGVASRLCGRGLPPPPPVSGMRWAWLWALWALGGVPGGAPCLLCSPEAAAALGELLGPFLARALPQWPARRAELGTLLLRGTLGLARLPRDPQTFMGVIDEATLEEASAHFRRTLARVMERNPRDQQLFVEMHLAMREVKENFEALMRRFQSQVFCPNTCGRMEVLWIECLSCNLTLYACNRGGDCGERHVRVEEGRELLLDCRLPWHRAAHGAKLYRFYRLRDRSAAPPAPAAASPAAAAAPPPAAHEWLLASGSTPLLLRAGAGPADGGRYRCEMRNTRGQLSSELRFHVTVTPRAQPPTQTPAPPPHARSRPPRALAVAAAVAAAAAAAIGGGAAAAWFRLRRGRPRDPARSRK